MRKIQEYAKRRKREKYEELIIKNDIYQLKLFENLHIMNQYAGKFERWKERDKLYQIKRILDDTYALF